MKSSELNDATIRDYLLGRLASEEQDEVEERMFCGDNTLARVDQIRTELVFDYVAGRLDPATREQYEMTIGRTHLARASEAVERELNRRATQPFDGRSVQLSTSRWFSFLFRPQLAWACTAVVVCASVFHHSRQREHFYKELSEARQQQAATATGLSVGFVLPGVSSTRSGGGTSTLIVPEGASCKLRTQVPTRTATRFSALLTKEGVNVWRGSATRLQGEPDISIETTVPAGVLLSGVYSVTWLAASPSSPDAPVFSETFTVEPR